MLNYSQVLTFQEGYRLLTQILSSNILVSFHLEQNHYQTERGHEGSCKREGVKVFWPFPKNSEDFALLLVITYVIRVEYEKNTYIKMFQNIRRICHTNSHHTFIRNNID